VTDEASPPPEPFDPIIIWAGTALGPAGEYRVVVNRPVDSAPVVTAERAGKDATLAPAWLPIPRAAGPTNEYEVSEEYARVLEAALTAIGERMNKVREKTREKKK
jgi:hypothetical protein